MFHCLSFSLKHQELGALGSVFQSSPSSSSLTAVHLDVVKSKGDFKLEEAELEWVVSRLCHIPPELLEQVMNIITSLIYCDHHSVSVLTSPLSTEIFHNILKVSGANYIYFLFLLYTSCCTLPVVHFLFIVVVPWLSLYSSSLLLAVS